MVDNQTERIAEMKIEHKRTGQVIDISPGDWEKMKQLGNRGNWKLVDKTTRVTEGREISITLEDITPIIETKTDKTDKHGKQRKKRAIKSADESTQQNGG